MSGQQPDDASLPPALRALRDLINAGGWGQIPGPPELVVFLHPYPDGSVDTLSIYGETNALVERTNPNGDPVALAPFLRELFAHGQVRVAGQHDREPSPVVMTSAGTRLLAELELEFHRLPRTSREPRCVPGHHPRIVRRGLHRTAQPRVQVPPAPQQRNSEFLKGGSRSYVT